MSGHAIFRYKCEGVFPPCLYSCRVYGDGRVVLEENSPFDDQGARTFEKRIPSAAVQIIKKLIDDNSAIFAIKEIKMNEHIVTDAATETVSFASANRRNSFTIYALSFAENESDRIPDPDFQLLVKLHKAIREILIANGISEDFC